MSKLINVAVKREPLDHLNNEELAKNILSIEKEMEQKRAIIEEHEKAISKERVVLGTLSTRKMHMKREISNRKESRFKEDLFKDYLHVLDRKTLEKVYDKAKQRAANEQELAEEFGDLLELVL